MAIRTIHGVEGGWFPAGEARSARQAGGESKLTIRGTKATLCDGYADAITLSAWAIYKVKDQWRLKGTIAKVDPWLSRRRPLVFHAPRPGGFWRWPVDDDSLQLGDRQLLATLGPPEH